MGVIKRGNRLWLRFKDANNEWRTVRSGLLVGQEAQAEEMLADAETEAARARGEHARQPIGRDTVRDYAEPWLERRKLLDLDWHADKSRMKTHILPRLGNLKLTEVRRKHYIELVTHLRTVPLESTGRVASQRTVYNVHSLLCAMMRDAEDDGKIDAAPKALDERQLGPLKDQDPEWRGTALLTREEVQTLITHEGIGPDRHVVYALECIAGVRPGEAAALRWRHYDTAKQPLGELLVAHSYNTKKSRAKGTKTDVTKHVPVHPVLAAMLAEWKLSGWAAMMGRPPTPDDLIVPLPPAAAERRRGRKGEPFRGTDYSRKRWVEDLEALDWRHRRHYDLRATFITLVVEDGADPTIIEERVTHTKKGRSAFKGYDRGEHWSRTCAEVSKLKITRKVGDESIAAAAGAENENDAARHSAVTVSAIKQDDSENKWRRWESNPTERARQDTPCTESRGLTLVRGGHTVSPAGENRHESSQPDSVGRALADARSAWDRDHDPVKLRRALLRLVADLD